VFLHYVVAHILLLADAPLLLLANARVGNLSCSSSDYTIDVFLLLVVAFPLLLVVGHLLLVVALLVVAPLLFADATFCLLVDATFLV